MRALLWLGVLAMGCSAAVSQSGGDTGAAGAASVAAGASQVMPRSGNPSVGAAGDSASVGDPSGIPGAVSTTTGSGGGSAGETGSGQAGEAAAEAGTAAGMSQGGAAVGGGGGSAGGGSAQVGGAAGSTGIGGSGVSGATACVLKTWYADLDGDGFGNAAQSTRACDAPDGYVADGSDCYDSNRDVHVGQLDWFSNDRGDGSFDYDCSGSTELRYPTFSPCPTLDNSCPPPNRWPSGFTCDYAGMMAPYRAEDGWRLYTANICPVEYCGTAAVKLPACGESGHYGAPPIGWDVAKSVYTCEAEPLLSDDQIARLPLRNQTCH